MDRDFRILRYKTADDFLKDMVLLGKPLETSLVGSFDKEGRGSRKDCELPFHRDGDYTTEYKDRVDIVALYCIKSGKTETLIELSNGDVKSIILQRGECILINNKRCRHSRRGRVGDRLLLRVWIEEDLNNEEK